MPDETLLDALPATGAVEALVAADPLSLWPLLADPSVPARFSSELRAATFADGHAPGVGAVIEGRNENDGFTWTTSSTITRFEPPLVIEWVTGDPAAPGARWSFEAAPDAAGTRLVHRVTLELGESPLRWAILAEPAGALALVEGRMAALLSSMDRTVRGIAALAAGGELEG